MKDLKCHAKKLRFVQEIMGGSLVNGFSVCFGLVWQQVQIQLKAV